jgi:uncharacterized protein (UPF0548 family)
MRLFKPTEEQLRSCLDTQSRCDFTYPAVGASAHEPPPGFTLDHNRVCLGQGPAVFESACHALRRWQMFATPWTAIFPGDSPIEPGRVVAMQARAFGLWWLNACRIVYVVDEVGRFGFAYGTLPSHVECGEERFLIERDADDRVWYDVRAFSRPRHPLVRLAYPLARRLQLRFVADSQAAMRNCVAAPAAIAGGRS